MIFPQCTAIHFDETFLNFLSNRNCRITEFLHISLVENNVELHNLYGNADIIRTIVHCGRRDMLHGWEMGEGRIGKPEEAPT